MPEVHDYAASLPHAVVQAIGMGGRQDQHERLYVQSDGRSSRGRKKDLAVI
jgi:hypothetical protein